jgi:hypothetical protein
MPAFVRRFTSFPSIETLSEIEAIDIVDLPPPAPTTGVGTGALLTIGEFEDGPFATGVSADAPRYASDLRGQAVLETFSSEDLRQKYGGFGFTYGTSRYQNPAARKHLLELWNGSGFMKLKFVKPKRLMISRVDTSVGQVAFSPLACLIGATAGPYTLAVADVLSLTTDAGGPASSTAIAAAVATAAGANFAASGFTGGETITIQVDSGPVISVVFAAADQTEAQVAARINTVLGYTAATVTVGVDIAGLVKGTSGRIILAEVTAGALAAMGHVAGTTNGTGNVANLSAVTTAELVTIINATAALIAIFATASVGPAGELRICRTGAGAASGTIINNSTGMSAKVGVTPAVTVLAGEHVAGTIPAGTRVRTAGGLEWVTMQTLTIPAGTAASLNPGPHTVKVRPATDNGSGVTTALDTVVVLTDQPSFNTFQVNNQSALTAALTEDQLDAAYIAALAATIDLTKPSREANFSISARRSDNVTRAGRQNALDASAQGHFGRKFIVSAPIGFTQSQAIADVALWRSDRVFYTWPGWRTLIPEIAEVGTAGGEGFTDDGVITVRGDGPLATLNCRLNPEENPGQNTDGLIDEFFTIEALTAPLGQSAYISLKANGICAPRVDRIGGSIYQSGITSDLTAGLTTQARRKMADFIQDSLAERLIPFSKQLATESRKDSIRGVVEQFLSELKSEQNPELARISDFSVDGRSGNTPEMEARGIFVLIIKVRTLSSLDAIVLQTEIGEGVTITSLAA